MIAASRTSAKSSGAKRFARHREPLTGRTVLTARTSRGTDVWVAPMPGFKKSYAMVTTRFGSLDVKLPDGTPLPDGIAHFLEHKMFQTEAGDVFDLYSARGASANAFTTFSHTSYLFSCTSRFEENLVTLYETMADIHTDPKGVEREKGIIGQEIAMYDDDPAWRGYFRLLQAMYREHPVRIDIAGTKETIAPLNPDILRRTHAAYYHPKNLVVVVAGDVDPEGVLERAEELLVSDLPGGRNRRPVAPDPRPVKDEQASVELSISRPHVYLGLKDTAPGPARRLVRREVQASLVLDALFGDGGRIQDPLYEEGIVDDSFGASYEADRDYAHAVVTAEVDAVEPYRLRLMAALDEAAAAGITAEETERAKRRLLGRHLRTFNAPERLAHYLLGVALEETPMGVDVAEVRAATRAALTKRLREMAAAPKAWTVLVPRAAHA